MNTHLNKLINSVEIATNKFNLISKNDKILCALSGGADSVALLYALKELSEKHNLTLGAAHFNHNIRGDEADRDANFCKELCQKLQINFYLGSENIPEIAKNDGLSLEECARNERYLFLEKISQKFGYNKIATAHHAIDNMETIIFHLIRGTGATGLCGIPPKRDNIIRPLILLNKDEILNYLNEKQISYVTDSTNFDTKMSRNRIRHNVIPELYKINS